MTDVLPLGWRVWTRSADGTWAPDWDGELHRREADARLAVAAARSFGLPAEIRPLLPANDSEQQQAARRQALDRIEQIHLGELDRFERDLNRRARP